MLKDSLLAVDGVDMMIGLGWMMLPMEGRRSVIVSLIGLD
jgi:hypothetical protein